MRAEYDFSKARRGRVLPTPRGKTRITIRIDNDILAWFREQAHRSGGGNYQTLMNQALRDYRESSKEALEATLRRVVREEVLRDRPRGTRRAARRTAPLSRRGPTRPAKR